ncbi:hypothetical protein BDQ12DRAFT_670046 [Crucibulum laeve]|uniref:Uncharacterized protein n=1 Tax=Crucibulum laeve TaxID=68775 RepID=A0A5C3LNZ7_9AGAR|nr:hypothetical protein BDQ12DRAFT_670046 [Crucibulum laeve]
MLGNTAGMAWKWWRLDYSSGVWKPPASENVAGQRVREGSASKYSEDPQLGVAIDPAANVGGYAAVCQHVGGWVGRRVRDLENSTAPSNTHLAPPIKHPCKPHLPLSKPNEAGGSGSVTVKEHSGVVASRESHKGSRSASVSDKVFHPGVDAEYERATDVLRLMCIVQACWGHMRRRKAPAIGIPEETRIRGLDQADEVRIGARLLPSVDKYFQDIGLKCRQGGSGAITEKVEVKRGKILRALSM